MQSHLSMRTGTALSVLFIFIFTLAIISWGIFSQTYFAGVVHVYDFGWYLFSFSSGIFLVGSTAVFPAILAFVSFARGRNVLNLVGMSFAFSVGTLLPLALLGFFGGFAGFMGFEFFSNSVEGWTAFGMLFLGAIVYTLALSEVDLISIVTQSGGEILIERLSRGKSIFGAFLLGMLLSVVDVHPVTLALFGGAMVKAEPLWGAGLMLMHGVGRIMPLLMAVAFAALGHDVSSWIAERKERIRLSLGWMMLILGSILINAALVFWVGYLRHGAIFGLLSNHFLLATLLLVPLWALYIMESRRVYGGPLHELKRVERVLYRAERERRIIVRSLRFHEGYRGEQLSDIEHKIDVLEKKRNILESASRHAYDEVLRSKLTQRLEERALFLRFLLTITISLFVVSILSMFT